LEVVASKDLFQLRQEHVKIVENHIRIGQIIFAIHVGKNTIRSEN
jgi:hypothetical protein